MLSLRDNKLIILLLKEDKYDRTRLRKEDNQQDLVPHNKWLIISQWHKLKDKCRHRVLLNRDKIFLINKIK